MDFCQLVQSHYFCIMRDAQSYRTHYILIFFCLGLLLSFLVFWNMDYYKQEEAQLETNSNLTFENIVRLFSVL